MSRRFIGGMRSFREGTTEPSLWHGANASWPLAESTNGRIREGKSGYLDASTGATLIPYGPADVRASVLLRALFADSGAMIADWDCVMAATKGANGVLRSISRWESSSTFVCLITLSTLGWA